jgi:pimeloyl-ACP methyl ester carboxylesterase
MATYVLIHGAWHTGKELEPTASPIRAAGHQVHTPTIAGNRPGDPKSLGLEDAIKSIVDYLAEKNLSDIILLGHSYGGMVITGVADRVPERIRRLVYWNAFVPNNGECLNDMVPPQYVALFNSIQAQRGDGSVVLPFPIWREAFINDVDLETAQKAYDILNPHPAKTFSDKISLRSKPADINLGKSYINCTEDTSLPHHYPWHPRLSQKLGLFRLVQTPGSHELCFSNPNRLAQAIMDAGRD